MSEPLLTLEAVHTHIGQYHILQGVDLTVPAGGVTVLLGRNGAGKTTTMRTIIGLWKASAGTIRFDGRPIQALPTPDIAKAGIAYVPENMGIFAGLTVRENLLLAAERGRFDQRRLNWILELFPALERFWQLPAGNLSGGQKQMLAIARAVIVPRRLLLVDEPSKGLAPAVVEALTEAFRQLIKDGSTTILLVEQNLAMAQALGEEVAVMDEGHIVHASTMAELVADKQLQGRLLGLNLESA